MSLVNLSDLFLQTQEILSREFLPRGNFTVACLSWAETVLPAFMPACRASLKLGDLDGIIRWRNWLQEDAQLVDTVFQQAGDSENARWRIFWMRAALDTATALSREVPQDDSQELALAEELSALHPPAWPNLPLPFWLAMIEWMSRQSGGETTVVEPVEMVFPLLLKKPVVVGNIATDVMLASFALECFPTYGGNVVPHPEQILTRCLAPSFLSIFSQAAQLAARGKAGLADIGVWIQPARTGPERPPTPEVVLFQDTLIGTSGGGALALALHEVWERDLLPVAKIAVSFALGPASAIHADGNCHVVEGGEEKVRTCALQGYTHLMVAEHQVHKLAHAGRRNSVTLIGAATFAQAVQGLSHVSSEPPSGMPISDTVSDARHVVILSESSDPEIHVANLLVTQLKRAGIEVFCSREERDSATWAQTLEQNLRDAGLVIVLLSEVSARSEMLHFTLQMARQTAQAASLVPVRVNFSGPLSERLAVLFPAESFLFWHGPKDDEDLVAEVEAVRAGTRRTLPLQDLEPGGGAVPPTSPLYIKRPVDELLNDALARRDGIILVKGAHQMGKTSLLAQGLNGAGTSVCVVYTDFQTLSESQLDSMDHLFRALVQSVISQLGSDVKIADVWNPKMQATTLDFEDFLEKHVLANGVEPLIWALDEVDRLFTYNYRGEVFGLFRALYNRRAFKGPWSRLTMIFSYSTEARLFITTPYQSPFNVGTRLFVQDFTPDQIGQLNLLYREPLRDEEQQERFYQLLSGQPFLVRRGLQEMMTGSLSLDQLIARADQEDGPFGDHLQHILAVLSRDSDMLKVMRRFLQNGAPPSREAFIRLRAAGLLAGVSEQKATFRCQLYETFLRRRLSPRPNYLDTRRVSNRFTLGTFFSRIVAQTPKGELKSDKE